MPQFSKTTMTTKTNLAQLCIDERYKTLVEIVFSNFHKLLAFPLCTEILLLYLRMFFYLFKADM